MTKSELIEKITAEHSDKLTKKDVKGVMETLATIGYTWTCLLYTSPSPRDRQKSRMPSSA